MALVLASAGLAFTACPFDDENPDELGSGGLRELIGLLSGGAWRPDCEALEVQVVATGIPGASAVAEVGRFHPGGPIKDRPDFARFTARGAVLDPTRVLVASSSSFGAPLARSDQPAGTILSIDGRATGLSVPGGFASGGGQATALAGKVQVYTAQSPAFLNRVANPSAVTADEPAVSLPLGISLNNGFGRPWFANAPRGARGDGTISVTDPNGVPLAAPPFPVAGGVFAGTATNRTSGASRGLPAAAVGTALLTKSPDGSGRAVFVAALADGSVAQVHVGKGVDDLLPPGTFAPLDELSKDAVESTSRGSITRVGVAFNWAPSFFLLVTDPRRDRILRVDLADDRTLFVAKKVTELRSRHFSSPVDIAATSPEVSHPSFSSGTTLGGGSDVYVLNRGDNTIARVRLDGSVVGRRAIRSPISGFRAAGIGVSADGQTIWLTGTAPDRGGALLRANAFGETPATRRLVESATTAGAKSIVDIGEHVFSFSFGVREGLGPLFNDRSCAACHNHPAAGGMGTDPSDAATLVGRVHGGHFDPLVGRGGPIARVRSVAELGLRCPLPTGVPPGANVTSVRNAMTLRGTALIDAIADADILANQTKQPEAVRGTGNRLGDGRLGRFGWKAQTATLVEFMAEALRDEMGVTSTLAPQDFVSGCGAAGGPEADGLALQALTAFMEKLDPPAPSAACLSAPGAAVFERIGCAACHTPTLSAAGESRHIYSDLLLHDMGPGLADGVLQASAHGGQWRTAPLWRLADRPRLLHDGRAANVTEAVRAHGGQAAAATTAFGALDASERSAVLAFLACI